MADPEIIDIDPGGDVVFICTAEDGHSVRIRVLSVFVSTASPVFKAMLGPKFKEGNTLATTSGVEVALPDDDSVAMTLIFKAMHMRISSLPLSLDLSLVKQLAAAVDKYNCAVPLAPITHYWIQRRLQAVECDLTELYELLHVTYLLEQHELFGQVGVKLVLGACSTIKGQHAVLMPAYDALEKQRLRMAMSVVKHLEDQVAMAFRRFGGYDNPECLVRHKYGSNFLEILQGWKLWGLDPDHIQIKTVFQTMRKIGFRTIGDGCPAHKTTGCSSTHARTPELIATTLFEAYADKAEQNLGHLCVKCLRAGDLGQKCLHAQGLGAFST